MAKKPKNFDAGWLFDALEFEYERHRYTQMPAGERGEQKTEILIPDPTEGEKVDDFMHLLAHMEETTQPAVIDRLASKLDLYGPLVHLIAYHVVVNLYGVLRELSAPDENPLGLKDEESMRRWGHDAVKGMEEILLDAYGDRQQQNRRLVEEYYFHLGVYALRDMEAEAGDLTQLPLKEFQALRHKHTRRVTERFKPYLMNMWSQGRAQDLLEDFDPANMPVERLAKMLRDLAGDGTGDIPEVLSFYDPFRIMSMSASLAIDRAARGPASWKLAEGELPRYKDARSGHFVEYLPAEVNAESVSTETKALEELQQRVMDMNPRAADVWRLITARALEVWREGQLEPPSLWHDVREIAEAMGYTKHVNGGMKPEHLHEVAKAIEDLDSFYITVPLGEKVLELPDGRGKRKSKRLEAARHYKVLHKVAYDDVRNLFGTSYPVRWKLKPGEWIQLYPRQFAPYFRALVELPANGKENIWAKSLGTELAYYYRQDQSRTPNKVLKVSTLLERACLLKEAQENRNKGRVRSYFEEALDLLQEIGVCEGWEYSPGDIDEVEAARNWFDVWLQVRANITAPKELIEALPRIGRAERSK